MYDKDYQAYLNVLRAREARPPIEQIARLIAAVPARPSFTIPLFAKFLSALAIGGMVAVGYWALSGKFHATGVAKNSFAIVKGALPSSDRSDRFYGTNRSDRSHGFHKALLTKYAHASFAEFAKPSPVDSVLSSTNAPLTACPVFEQAIPFSPVAADTYSLSSNPIPIPKQESERKFFASYGGSVSQQFSSNASFRQISFSDAFLGIGYDLSHNSSVRILVGEETFNTPSNTTTNSIAFHDTTFVQNGQTYQNVIGEIQSANIPVLTRVFWLGASYRYTLGDETTAIRPFAEAMAGGSTDGFLTHQSLGAEFTATSRLDLDLLFEASELLPQNSTWLTKAGFVGAVSYRW